MAASLATAKSLAGQGSWGQLGYMTQIPGHYLLELTVSESWCPDAELPAWKEKRTNGQLLQDWCKVKDPHLRR